MEGTVCKAISSDHEVSVTKREVTSYKAMFGNVDRVREIVAPGAFVSWPDLQKSIANMDIPTRHNHKDLVGLVVHAEEDSVGFLTTDKYGVDYKSDRVFSLVRDRIINKSSFRAMHKASDRVKQKGSDGEPVWVLKALRLCEAGPADPDFAVNPETRVVSVKGLVDIASVLTNASEVEIRERWTLEGIKMLSAEDKDALASILSMLPHGEAVESILVALQGEQAEDMTGKAIDRMLEITELYRAARFDGLLDRISNSLTKCRPSAALTD